MSPMLSKAIIDRLDYTKMGYMYNCDQTDKDCDPMKIKLNGLASPPFY